MRRCELIVTRSSHASRVCSSRRGGVHNLWLRSPPLCSWLVQEPLLALAANRLTRGPGYHNPTGLPGRRGSPRYAFLVASCPGGRRIAAGATPTTRGGFGGEPHSPPQRRRRGLCAVAGCARPAKARGWCKTHYSSWRSTGTIDDPLPVSEASWQSNRARALLRSNCSGRMRRSRNSCAGWKMRRGSIVSRCLS